MIAVQAQQPQALLPEDGETKSSRRMNRRRSSRISSKAIRSVVAKMSTSASASISGDPTRILLHNDSSHSDDEGETGSSHSSRSCLSQHGVVVNAAGSPDDTQCIGASTMSFSELIPKEPVHLPVGTEEVAPTRTLLRRPSGCGNHCFCHPEDAADAQKTMNDSHKSLVTKGSLDMLDLAADDEESFCGDDSHQHHHHNSSNNLLDESSLYQMAASRASSLGMLSTSDYSSDSEDDDSDSDFSYGPQHALQFLPPELNTLLNLSPEHPTGKLTLSEDVPPRMLMESLTDTEVVGSTRTMGKQQLPKSKRPSKGEKVPKRRKSTVVSDSVRSTRTSGSKVTRGEQGEVRRSSRSKLRTSKNSGTSTSRRRTSSVELKDASSSRRRETKLDSSSKRRSNTEMKEPSFRRRRDAMDTSSRRRNTASVDSSIRKSKHSGNHDSSKRVRDSSVRRTRRSVQDSSCNSNNNNNSNRDGMNVSNSSRGIRRGSSVKPRPRKVESDGPSDRQVIRRCSYCLPSEVPPELRHPPVRSFSSTNETQKKNTPAPTRTVKEATAAKDNNHETSATTNNGKRPSRRNNSSAASSKTNAHKPTKAVRSREASRPEASSSRRVGRRTSARSPAVHGGMQHRRSRSMEEVERMPGLTTLSRRKSTEEPRAPRPGDNKGKNVAPRRYTSDEDDDDDDDMDDGEDNVLIVKPLQLVFDPVAAESDRAVISCQKSSFPSHYNYDDMAKVNASQRSARLTGLKANNNNKEGGEMLSASHHSSKIVKTNIKDHHHPLEKAPRNESFSNLHRASKQLKHQKPSNRTKALHESFMF